MLFGRRALPLILGALTFVIQPGCAQGGARVDRRDASIRLIDGGGRDSGQNTDAFVPLDAEVPLDSGTDSGADMEMDAFVPPLDSGVPPLDSGVPPLDSGVPPLDSGIADAGEVPIDGGASDTSVGDRCLGVDCSSRDTACMRGQCEPLTGLCTSVPRENGTACEDGNLCTIGDVCTAGSCSSGTARDCSAMNSACAMGICNPSTGSCQTTPANNGASCDSDPNDCLSGTCNSGSCAMRPIGECSPCGVGGTNVCSGGTCGPAPSTLTYDFESGLPNGWTVGAANGWIIDGSRFRSGSNAAHSAAIGNNGSSSMTATFTLSRPARVVFWYATGTEPGYDWLEIWVDGAQQARWSGTNDWTQGAADIGAGTHSLEFRYTRDSSGGDGGDRVWIDDVSVANAPPAIGFEAGPPDGFTTSGPAGWTIDTSRPHSGSRSVRSGTIGDNQTSILYRTIVLSRPATMSYWYSVSSEQHADFLELWINGVLRERASGTVGWTFTSYPLPAGTHAVEWRYMKDFSAISGTDRAWIDDIVTGEEPPSGEPICGS